MTTGLVQRAGRDHHGLVGGSGPAVRRSRCRSAPGRRPDRRDPGLRAAGPWPPAGPALPGTAGAAGGAGAARAAGAGGGARSGAERAGLLVRGRTSCTAAAARPAGSTGSSKKRRQPGQLLGQLVPGVPAGHGRLRSAGLPAATGASPPRARSRRTSRTTHRDDQHHEGQPGDAEGQPAVRGGPHRQGRSRCRAPCRPGVVAWPLTVNVPVRCTDASTFTVRLPPAGIAAPPRPGPRSRPAWSA